MEKLYSITRAGNRWLVKFATPPPEVITNELKRDRACKWDAYRKHWVCTTDDQFIMRMERDLAERDWQRVQAVEAQKAPLTAVVSEEGTSVVVRFSRRPDDAVREAVAAIGVRDAQDKTRWFVPAEPAGRQQLTNVLARFPAIQVEGLGHAAVGAATGGTPVSFSASGSAVTLHFPGGLPPGPKLARVKGALQMLGYDVTEGAAPAQPDDDDDDE